MTILWSFPSSPLIALMVMFNGSAPFHTVLSVRAVSRNFSRASLAFEMSSRRKISLKLIENLSQLVTLKLTCASKDWVNSDLTKPPAGSRNIIDVPIDYNLP